VTLYSPNNGRPFLFTHIYRTGGNSLRELIRSPESFEIGSPHALPADVKAFVSEPTWQTAFRFTVVRHPYTWLASTWAYVMKFPHREREHAEKGFREYVEWIADVGLALNHGPLRDRHALQVEFAKENDRVWKFEDEPIRDICAKLHLPEPDVGARVD